MKYVITAGTEISPTHAAKVQKVKNLGWLLRHAGDVTEIRVFEREHGEARLVARGDGFIFASDFASFAVACCWVERPSLRHADLSLVVLA